jgi:hypothetical protein
MAMLRVAANPRSSIWALETRSLQTHGNRFAIVVLEQGTSASLGLGAGVDGYA